MISNQAHLGFGAGLGGDGGGGGGGACGASGDGDDGASNPSKAAPTKPAHRLSAKLVFLPSHLQLQSL
jgi:hypothetical protein